MTVTLPRAAYIYDLGAQSSLGLRQELRVALDPVVPSFFALSATLLPAPTLSLQRAARRGKHVSVRLGLAGSSPAAFHVLHLEVTDASGTMVPDLSGNSVMRGVAAVKELPLAQNAPTGTWHVSAIDVLSGKSVSAAFTVAR